MSRKYIIRPPKYRSSISDRYEIFFDMLKREMGFDIIFSCEPKIPTNASIVLAHTAGQHSWPSCMINLVNLPRSTKLIFYVGDPWPNSVGQVSVQAMLNRSDVVLSCSDEHFSTHWEKPACFKFFPNFFATHERYASLPIRPISELVTDKLLCVGAMAKDTYPLRHMVYDMLLPGEKIGIPHAGWHPTAETEAQPNIYTRERFAQLIHKHFVTLSSSTIFGVMVAKASEITAAGSLLVTNPCNDMTKAGLIAGKHYVSVTKDNAISTIRDILSNPAKYDQIRRAGTEYSRSNLSVKNRFEQLKQIINEL